jgi:N-acetylglucosaminyldiphosphoundecaprenol N-acetyl-beta-D-mannosaminyltransferase
MEFVRLLGIKISNLTEVELNDEIKKIVELHGKGLVLNVNINCMNIAVRNDWLSLMLNNAYINFCDGDGVRLGARLQGHTIKEKITYNRWIWEFARFSEENGLSWYLIGTRNETIARATDVISTRYPQLRILGSRNGFFRDTADINMTIADINRKRPNILILGLGMPLQEKWLYKHWEGANCNVALTGGAVFDYVAGDARMTPNIFYRLKLEWFFRFLCNPRRLFTRYFVGNPLFLLRVLLEKYHITKYETRDLEH